MDGVYTATEDMEAIMPRGMKGNFFMHPVEHTTLRYIGVLPRKSKGEVVHHFRHLALDADCCIRESQLRLRRLGRFSHDNLHPLPGMPCGIIYWPTYGAKT